jgi:alpha-D-ribose 1-methylphosphonate 5-triphosphate synthase subunit PhnH
MSTSLAVKSYDPVFDGQKHYRTILQATARPGTIGQLDDAALDVPPQLNRASALLALALFTGDISYHLDLAAAATDQFLQRETAAKPAKAAQADFLIFPSGQHYSALREARTGTLTFPDQGATAIVQAEAISPAPIFSGIGLLLSGPGIETEAEVYVRGVSGELFEVLRERNAEFPVGVDTFFTCDSLAAGPCVLALPRTTHVQWKQM